MNDSTAPIPEVAAYNLPDHIASLMQANDWLALSQMMDELMSMPQSLCRSVGGCCRFANFKGCLSYDEIQALAFGNDNDTLTEAERQSARDFLELFEPHQDQAAAAETSAEFLTRLKAVRPEVDTVTLFKCRYLADNNRCQIHEDRPTGCRVYPFPHDRTLYHPGCGYEETGLRNLRYLKGIHAFFERHLASTFPTLEL
jgi:Fe-S-cluster containining protein